MMTYEDYQNEQIIADAAFWEDVISPWDDYDDFHVKPNQDRVDWNGDYYRTNDEDNLI